MSDHGAFRVDSEPDLASLKAQQLQGSGTQIFPEYLNH